MYSLRCLTVLIINPISYITSPDEVTKKPHSSTEMPLAVFLPKSQNLQTKQRAIFNL